MNDHLDTALFTLEGDSYSTSRCLIQQKCCFSWICGSTRYQAFAPNRTVLQFSKRDRLWFGEPDEQDILIILSGAAMSLNYRKGGDEIIYGIITAGQALGVGDFMIQRKAPFTVEFLFDTEICVINAKLLRQILAEVPQAEICLSYAIYNNFVILADYLEILSAGSVYERVKKTLMYLAKTMPVQEKGVPLRITHEDLARLVRSNRVTVTRALKRHEKDGLVELGNRTITVIASSGGEEALIKYLTPNILANTPRIRLNERINQPSPGPLPSNLPNL